MQTYVSFCAEHVTFSQLELFDLSLKEERKLFRKSTLLFSLIETKCLHIGNTFKPTVKINYKSRVYDQLNGNGNRSNGSQLEAEIVLC